MILKLCFTVFFTQLIFISCRTWNVKAVAKNDLKQVLISGAFVHISWLVAIAIGASSTYKILVFEWQYLPVIICSLAGGLIGSYIGLQERNKNK